MRRALVRLGIDAAKSPLPTGAEPWARRGQWPASVLRSCLLATLVGAVEGLAETAERKGVCRSRSLRGRALYYGALARPHGLDHMGLFRRVLDPGAVLLGVERKRGRADIHGRLRIRLERITDDDRDLVAHL